MLKFKYKKANGDVSERVGLIMQPARTNDLMLDLTDCCEDDRIRAELLLADYREKLDALNEEYRLLRQFMKEFKPEGIYDRQPL